MNHCLHCGDTILLNTSKYKDTSFCCEACKTVYEILSSNNLAHYYSIESNAGINPNHSTQSDFSFLNNDTGDRLLSFKDELISIVKFQLPTIHCSSCIWLLENLYRINNGVKKVNVNFTKKEATIHFHHDEINLAELANLLQKIGYKPEIHLDQIEQKENVSTNNKLIYQIAVAGFSFGNIMFLGFTEYFDTHNDMPQELNSFFGWIAFALSLPVLFYASTGYFKSAYTGIRNKYMNIDIPISLGIVALFIQSTYEVISKQGLGYFDSLSGLVFFLLLGKLFQNKTYQKLSFDRDYKSYFPISILKITDGTEISCPITEIQVGDTIRVKNEEIIPCDSILSESEAHIDNSFITGESKLVIAKKGDLIYSGAKNIGKSIKLSVHKEVSQSYLTQLWNQDVFKSNKKSINDITNTISKYFTISVLSIAFVAFLFWLRTDYSKAIYVLSSVLIVACPCALALSAPFTLGNTLRILGKEGFYLKNGQVIEQIAKIQNIIFDKTGTLTQKDTKGVSFHGTKLTKEQKTYIHTLTKQSSHPLSTAINRFLQINETYTLSSYSEVLGKGIEGIFNKQKVKLGSADFIGVDNTSENTRIYISIDSSILGYFQIEHVYRPKLAKLFNSLAKNYKLGVLSGDTNASKTELKKMLPKGSYLGYNKKPIEKLEQIKKLQKNKQYVMMIGDGLNDAGALKQSDVGISISENLNSFTPASDAILDASAFIKLPNYLRFCKDSINIIKCSFVISWLYNLVGLYFAVQGLLSPVIAAILMPLSSITIVVFTSVSTNLLSKHRRIQSASLA